MTLTTQIGWQQARRPAASGHFGAWRTVVAVPAIIGSSLLLLVLGGCLGQWEIIALGAWVASGFAVSTEMVQRILLHTGYGFRRPTSRQAAVLDPLWNAALQRCGPPAGQLRLYVQRDANPNACAAGDHGVAVTTGLIDQFLAARLTREAFVAVLVHEIGHHATGATRCALVAGWLAGPWRFATRVTIGLALALSGRQPKGLLAAVIVFGAGATVVQTAQQGQWLLAVAIAAIAVAAVGCPFADAAIARRSEYAADRYTAQRNLGPQLAGALRALNYGQPAPRGLIGKALDRHPTVDRRVQRIAP